MSDRNPSLQLLQPRPTTATTSTIFTTPAQETCAATQASHEGDRKQPLSNVAPIFSKNASLRGTVRIKVEGTTFYCHREVLILASPFFESVLRGGWRETEPPTVRPDRARDRHRASLDTTQSFVSATSTDHGEAHGEPAVSDSAARPNSLSSSTVSMDADSLEQNDDDDWIECRLTLPEERAASFHDLLLFIYPRTECLITWQNIEDLCRMSGKFDLPKLHDAAVAFLLTSAAGKPILALKIAEETGLPELYKEASRYVLDNVWPPGELQMLSESTLLKLERRRSWFLERLLKLNLVSPAKEYCCQPACIDPINCARLIDEKWRSAWSSAFRFGTSPQPSIIYRSLRNLEPSLSSPALHLPHTACQAHGKAFVADLFDRMFMQTIVPARSWVVAGTFGRPNGESVPKSSARYFLHVEMDGEKLKAPKSHP